MSSTNNSASRDEQIFARGKIFELVHLPQPDGRTFEMARRAPGTRVIIPNLTDKTVLLTREFRFELDGYDYRVPGGKVFDTLPEYDQFRQSGREILPVAASKAKAESAEEAGIQVEDLKLLKKSTLGATVEWDLYIFEATAWRTHPQGQQPDVGEPVESVMWVTFQKAQDMILSGQIQDERIAITLLQWLHDQQSQRV